MTDRSAEELERDAERIRSGIAHTAEELKYRMQPGHVVDEMTRYLRESDSSIALDNMRRQIRDNPLALALVGTGVAWLIFGNRQRGSGYGYRESYGEGEFHGGYDGPPADTHAAGGTGVGYVAGADGTGSTGSTGSTMGELGARTREAVNRASEAGRDYAHRAREAGQDYRHRAGEATEGVSDRMREFVHDARDRVRDWGTDAGSRVRDFTERAEERWHDVSERGRHWTERRSHSARDQGSSLVSMIEREPFLAGAIGLAIGVALGTMLPKTRIEKETYQDARAQVRRGAERAFDYASDRARHMAQDVYEAGRAAAEREGLVPSGERTMAERVGNVARAAADAAVEDTEHEAARDDAGNNIGGSAAGTAGAGSPRGTSDRIPGAGIVRPKTGTDDLTSRAATQTRDTGAGGTGSA